MIARVYPRENEFARDSRSASHAPVSVVFPARGKTTDTAT